MAERVKPPRGTQDLLGPPALLRERILAVARETFATFGYGPITTPTFEHTEVFARGVGASTDIVGKEMYDFTDRSGRELTLRPEGTASVARAYVSNGLHKQPQPVKLWYVAPMFRYETPQGGRYREHWQFGAEALGSSDPLLDVEAIALLATIYARLEVRAVTLRVSSMGDPETRAAHRAELLAYLAPRADNLPEDAQKRLADNPLRLFDSKDEAVRPVMAGAPRLLTYLSAPARAHHERVLAGLDALGIAYEIDGTLVRGMDYYTHTVFEFESGRLGAQASIGGGGRYDGLVAELGGPPTPGIGFGAGVERIMLALGDEALPAPAIDCYLAVIGEELELTKLTILSELRAAGLRCDAGTSGRGLKAMMRHAGALGARRAVIIGPRDHERGMATVRDMQTGEQGEVALADLAAALR